MAYVIEWTHHAQDELNAIFDYIEANWASREIINFSKLLEHKLSLIVQFPYLYAVSAKKKSVRRCVLSKQTSLYYQIEMDKIIILSLFDNRKNPDEINW